ncbi:hypothetical protein Tco_1227307 [Tanacetum coccineum]
MASRHVAILYFIPTHSPSTSSIIVDEHETPPIVTTSDEQISPISLKEADEFNQEDSAHSDGNSQFVSHNPPSSEEIESSTMALEPSNMRQCRMYDECKSPTGGLQFLVENLIWMRTQLLDYGYKYNRIPMYCDSKSAIAISCNPVQHSKTKHIDIRYHFIKEHVEKVIIMAQQQHAADVHPDELCPPNKRYDLMDANKKVDLEHVQCPPESKILTNIIKNHPLRFSIAASSSVPWIYMAQFWHTLKEDGSKYRLRFMLDKKELSLTLDDFRTIFHLPQANDNNHNSFVPPPSFSEEIGLKGVSIIFIP